MLAAALILTLAAFASADEEEYASPTDFVLAQIAAISADDAPCPWSEETKIDSVIELHDMQKKPNGYVYKLKTGQADCGFIQINDIDGTYSIYCYAYGGNSEVEEMAKYSGIDLDECECIYFVGCFSYMIEGGNGEFVAINACAPVDLSVEELTEIEEAIQAK